MQGKEDYEIGVKSNDIQEMAFALEVDLNASQPPLIPQAIGFLEKKLDNIYQVLQPIRKDYEAREAALKFVDELVRNKLSVGDVLKQYGFCYARTFGSFTMDMFTAASDLDISLNVEFGATNFSREQGVRLLKKLTRLLHKLKTYGVVKDVQPIMKAKVPVVKFVHCATGIECDVSVENRDGMIKSDFLRIFSCIDPRFRKLCFLVKAWANTNAINSSKEHTLNSLSIVLLVAFHLQTRTPAILPPFSALLEGNDLMTSEGISVVQHQVRCFEGFGIKNKDTIAQLFNSFLIQMLAVKDMWKQGLCASTYQGKWAEVPEPGLICVEDFTKVSQNTARAVNADGFNLLYYYLQDAHSQIKRYAADASKSLIWMFTPTKATEASSCRKKRHLDHTIEEPKKNHVRQADGPSHDARNELASWDMFQTDHPKHNATIRREHTADQADGGERMFTSTRATEASSSRKKRHLDHTIEEPKKNHVRQADGPSHDVRNELASWDMFQTGHPKHNATIRREHTADQADGGERMVNELAVWLTYGNR